MGRKVFMFSIKMNGVLHGVVANSIGLLKAFCVQFQVQIVSIISWKLKLLLLESVNLMLYTFFGFNCILVPCYSSCTI